MTRRVTLVLSTAGALVAFLWPLLISASAPSAAFVFVAILPVLVAVVLAEVASGRLDAKAIAMLGVLSAVNAALRPLGAGIAGIETVFFLLILAGRVFGPGFGFVLGSTSMFASALLTAGVGPWLPFQMLAASWIGFGAGLLPVAVAKDSASAPRDGTPDRIPGVRKRWEIAMLAVYGVFAAYAYGFLMNLSFWPFSLGTDTQLSYVAGAPIVENLHRFFVFSLVTSGLGWDTGRAITNVLAIVVLGPAVLLALRRAARRAAFDAPVLFDSKDSLQALSG